MFVSNSTNLFVPWYDFIVFVLKWSAIIITFVLGWVTFLGPRYHVLTVNSLFFLVLTATIQYYLLSESIYILNGENINPYNSSQLIGDFLIYTLIGALIYAFRNGVYRNFRKFGMCICLFELINLGVLIQSKDHTPDAVPKANVDVSAFGHFSRKENVLHVVFDGFQSGLFQDIIESDNNIVSELEGFLYFPDTLTPSEVTQLSFSAFLTGREYTNNEPMNSYLFESRVLRMGKSEPVQHVPNVLEVAARRGFQVEVATPFVLFQNQEFYSRFFFIHRPYHSETNFREVINYQINFILDLILFRSTPKGLKKFVYNEGRWRLSGVYVPNSGLNFNHHAGVQFLRDVTNEFALSKHPRVYKLFHLITPHGPFVTDANCGFAGRELDREYKNIYNQARCALVQLIDLLQKMKNAGIYDSTTILVHGDHGIRLPFPEFSIDKNNDGDDLPSPIGNSNPLLLIKPPGKRGNLATVGAEISLADIPETLSELLQLNVEFPGVDFLSHKPIDRKRRFYHSKQSRVVAGRDGRFRKWIEYEVSGPLWRKSSWRKVREHNWTKKDFSKFPIGEFVQIEQFTLTKERVVQIRYRDRERHHFVAVGSDKRVTRFVGTDLITAKLKSKKDIERVCIVDMVRELRQCIQ